MMRVYFACPTCDNEYVFDAEQYDIGAWDVHTPEQCVCGRAITNADRAQLSRTCEANRIEGLRDACEAAKDREENWRYDRSIGR